MTIFNYVSVDKKGHIRKGVLDGQSAKQIRQKLQEMGLTLIELKSEKESGQTFNLFSWRRKTKMSSATLALITFQLGTLLTAGLPIAMALQNIAEQMENPDLKTILLTVRTRMLEGHTLAYGMNEFPDVFPELYRATIAAGYKAGHIDEVINKLAVYLEQQELIKQKIKQALIYPALLTFVSGAIIYFLLTYAMPKITQTFIESGQALPTITQYLLDFSTILKTYGIYVVLLLIAGFYAFKRAMKTESFKYKVHLFYLRIPMLNQAYIITNAARFSRTFGILFAAGVPVAQAMETANNIVTLLPMREAIKQAIVQVVEGVSIHQALMQTGYFTKMSTQLISSGEASGKLDIMLEKTALYQEQQVLRWISTTLSLFEPIMILSMGVVVLFIVLGILLPIFQMNDFVS